VIQCAACGGPLDERSVLTGFDRLYGTRGEYSVAVCPACGSGRTLPLVSSDQLGAFYPSQYNAYGLPENPVLRTLATALFERRYRHALRSPPLGVLLDRAPGRLLDVGSGRGDLGVVLGRSGWRVTGLEPSPDAVAEARKRGVESQRGTLTEGPRPEGRYDAVVFNHSLEHVVEPFDDLSTARELLHPGGLVLISLPNFGSWQASRFGSRWFHLDLPRHRTHFTEHGLETLLRRAGLTHILTSTSTSADGFPMSVQYRFFGRRHFATGAGRYLSIGAMLALVPVTVAANAVAGAGDLLHAVAEKSRDAD
jgi:2-polyprenyl-3-methyl-5-hydroxy-6-metoxy-1,4-benzoquinol methylase